MFLHKGGMKTSLCTLIHISFPHDVENPAVFCIFVGALKRLNRFKADKMWKTVLKMLASLFFEKHILVVENLSQNRKKHFFDEY